MRSEPSCARDRPRGRRGQAAVAADRRPGQAGRAVRRQLPARSTSCCPTWSTPATCGSCVLTQYKSHSLDRHITTTWRMSTLLGNYVTPVPAQQRLGPRWYTGSADAIFQSLNLIYDEQPDYIVVFGADHVYRMDPRQMVEQHIESGAGGDRRRHPGAARRRRSEFGVIDADERRQDPRVPGEAGRPARPAGQPRRVVRLDGQLRLHHRGAARGAAHGRRRRGLRARHGRQHHPDAGRATARRRSTTSPTTTCPAPTDRDRGYWRDVGTHRRLLRRAHGPGLGAPGLQPLQPAVADLHRHRRSCRRRSSSRAASPRSRSSAPARSSPARPCGTRWSRRASPSLQGAYVEGAVLHARRADRARARSSAGRSWTRTSWSRPARTSASTRSWTSSATTSATAASSCSARASSPSRDRLVALPVRRGAPALTPSRCGHLRCGFAGRVLGFRHTAPEEALVKLRRVYVAAAVAVGPGRRRLCEQRGLQLRRGGSRPRPARPASTSTP